MRKFGTTLIAAALAFATAPVLAQDDQPIRLTTSGTVMVSSGGEYVTAVNGQTVVPNQSFMVHAGSAATLTFDDDCTISYPEAGTYVVPDDCDPAVAVFVPAGSSAAVGTAGVAGTALGTAAIVGGAVVAAAAGINAVNDDNDEDDDEPVSP